MPFINQISYNKNPSGSQEDDIMGGNVLKIITVAGDTTSPVNTEDNLKNCMKSACLIKCNNNIWKNKKTLAFS